jgi:hypothetical protein
VPSASRPIIAGLGLAVLAGCTTTQQQAARVQVNSARIRASQVPLRVSGRNTQVRVLSARLIDVGGSGRSAIVVRLRNTTSSPVSDLPLLVGVFGRRGGSLDLNARAGLGYFQNHVPAIGPQAVLNWVLVTHRRLPAGSAPFARVGRATAVSATITSPLPALRVTMVRELRGRAILNVRNLSGVPQLQLPVYALAQRGGHAVAAGQATIEELDSGASLHVGISLVGRPVHAALSLQVPPTIFK